MVVVAVVVFAVFSVAALLDFLSCCPGSSGVFGWAGGAGRLGWRAVVGEAGLQTGSVLLLLSLFLLLAVKVEES